MIHYRALVIDDSSEICALVQQLLQEHGYTVDTASSSEEARHLLMMREYDVILLDQALGDEDGSEFLMEILGTNPTQSVLMMTAFATIEKAVNALKRGAFGYIAKPFDNHQL